MVNAINAYRKENNRLALTEDAILDQTAKDKACDMMNNHYFAHKDTDGNYSWDHVEKSGYHYLIVGENLSRGSTNDTKIMAALIDSPTHRQNLLNPEFEDVGIGRCGEFTVQQFGRTR
jgi:uncharacterized protein YkwD